jgi:hypothetical protein
MINHAYRPAPTVDLPSRGHAAHTETVELDQLMAAAYQLFLCGQYVAADLLCRRLILRDRAYWWCHALRAAALAKLGRFDDALDALDRGLVHEQGDPKLLHLRTQILAAIGASLVRRRAAGPASSTTLRRPGYER